MHLSLYIGLAAAPVAVSLTTRSAGSNACLNLTSLLGASKVESNHVNPRYIATRENYWSTRQGTYAPACVVYAETSKDVSLTIRAIKAADSRFAIKAGGHSPNKYFSSVEDGVLIDLGSMTAKSYDAETTLATYEPGSSWGELYKYYEQYGVTVMGGRVSGVGTGLALGGGLSYLSPQYGMACDSFRELEVVLPSGDIVTASADSNPDLFLGLRGGGGNAYGIVTKYTVQSRPVGKFYAGALLYLFEQTDAVIQAIYDFIAYNTDPKATILPTYEKLPTPDADLNLDEVITVFLVYDGEDAGGVFDNFTNIPHFLDTRSVKTYPDVANMPLPSAGELTRGDNVFRSGVHHIGDNSHSEALKAWRDWAEENKGSYFHTGFYLYPVARSLTDASRSQGGNAMQMPDGPWFWRAYLLLVPPGISEQKYNEIQESFERMVASIPNASNLPLFLNEAALDQNPLSTFSTFQELQQAKHKYDPDGFFSARTGGWSFSEQ